MVFNREQAADRANASHTNTPGTCQLWTRTQFGAPSAGDQDRDGDADAVDGWKSEPPAHRHADRNPPQAFPSLSPVVARATATVPSLSATVRSVRLT